MKLGTGLKALIGISVLGIAVAVLLIYTCPFAGQIAFSTLVRQVPMEHNAGPTGHSQQHGAEAQKPHGGMEKHEGMKEERHEDVKAHSAAVQKPHDATAEEHKESGGEHHEAVKAHPEPAQKPHDVMTERHEEGGELKVHLMVTPNVRSYPIKETKVFGIEVSPLGIIVLLVLIALCFLILRQRPLNLFGYTLTPKTMGETVFLATLWNLVVAAFLLVVEVVQLKEL